jgi:uncharacterized membrane protein YphA (DoxX/SURF4 family)
MIARFAADFGFRQQEPVRGFLPPLAGDFPFVPSRYAISVATVVMLVLLRLVIGWHFFSEGMKHYADANWTSEPVLRAAKGPLAPLYHSYLSDFHGFERSLHADISQTPEHAVQGWIDEVQKDWDEYRQQFSLHFDLDETAQKRAGAIMKEHQARLRSWAAMNKDALATHVHQWQRKEQAHEKPEGELPFQQKRLAAQQSSLAAEAAGWLAELKGLERQYENELAAIVGDEQPRMPRATTSIDVVDGTMTYTILAIGLLLLLGLFTRAACSAGAVFLLSVVMMQPFWVAGSAPTFKEYVEMFALLTLATTPVGRWAGLDFFLVNLISRPCCSTKGKTDVSES